MATTNLNIKTDILRTSIHEHGIPFALKLDIPNEITIAAIEEGRKLMPTLPLRDIPIVHVS